MNEKSTQEDTSTVLPLTANCCTPEKVAAMLGVTVNSLAGWRSRGGGPIYFKLAGRIYYREEDVLDWFNQQYELTKGGGGHSPTPDAA